MVASHRRAILDYPKEITWQGTLTNAKNKARNWTSVREHVPPEGKFCLAYSKVHGVYHIAAWSAARGWVDQLGERFSVITHWCDEDLDMPYAITGEINMESAKEYGLARE
jgi:hypothetical protein